MKVIAYIRHLVANSQRKSLAHYKLATVNAAQYLQKINLEQLAKSRKPSEGQDKKEFYLALQKEALDGPIFNKSAILRLEAIPMDLNKEEVKWLANILMKETSDIYGFPSIFDWSRATDTKLDKLSFSDAERKSEEWHEQFHNTGESTGKYKTKDVIFKLPDGYTIVKIMDPADLNLEGEIMQHCVGGYCDLVMNGNSTIYSLRDANNKPHATLEIKRNGQITQIYGKQNKEPALKYQEYLIQWLPTLKTTSWINIVGHWAIADIPKYKDILDKTRLRDPSYVNELALAEGHKTKYQDIILESESAKHIYEYASNHTGRAEVDKLTKAIAATSDFRYIQHFAATIPNADIKLLENRLLTAKQEENLNQSLPNILVKFAETVNGASIKALEKAVLSSGNISAIVDFATYIPTADMRKLENAVLKSEDPESARKFATRVEGADIKALQKVVESKANPQTLYDFAAQVAGADRKSLEKAVINFKGIKDTAYPGVLYSFAKLRGADTEALEKALLSLAANSSNSYINILYKFAKEIEGANVKKLAAKLLETFMETISALGTPRLATTDIVTRFARIPGAPIEDLQDFMLKHAQPWDLVGFAEEVKGVDIKKLQDRVIELDYRSEMENFSHLPGADKELLDKAIKESLLKDQASGNKRTV